MQAEETWPLVCILLAHGGQGAYDSSGVVLKENGKSGTGYAPLPDLPLRFVAFPKNRPRFFLVGQELET